MVERLEQLLKKKNLSPAQLADEIGVQRSGFYHIMKGRNKPGMDFLTKLLNHFPDVNPGWLILGKGPMIVDQELSLAEEPQINTPGHLNVNVPRKENKIENSKKVKGYSKKPDDTTQIRNIERIVVFYDDQSFVEYQPNKKPA